MAENLFMRWVFLELFLLPGNRAGVRALLRRGSLNAGKAWIRGRFRAGVFSLCNPGGTGPLPVIRGHEISGHGFFLG